MYGIPQSSNPETARELSSDTDRAVRRAWTGRLCAYIDWIATAAPLNGTHAVVHKRHELRACFCPTPSAPGSPYVDALCFASSL